MKRFVEIFTAVLLIEGIGAFTGQLPNPPVSLLMNKHASNIAFLKEKVSKGHDCFLLRKSNKNISFCLHTFVFLLFF